MSFKDENKWSQIVLYILNVSFSPDMFWRLPPPLLDGNPWKMFDSDVLWFESADSAGRYYWEDLAGVDTCSDVEHKMY